MRELSFSYMEDTPHIQAFGFGTRARGHLRSSIWPPAIVGLGEEGEFDAVAHGVDALGADADFIAEVPFEGAGLGAAAGGRSGCTATANETRTRRAAYADGRGKPRPYG